jgi:hypothetical protein
MNEAYEIRLVFVGSYGQDCWDLVRWPRTI